MFDSQWWFASEILQCLLTESLFVFDLLRWLISEILQQGLMNCLCWHISLGVLLVMVAYIRNTSVSVDINSLCVWLIQVAHIRNTTRSSAVPLLTLFVLDSLRWLTSEILQGLVQYMSLFTQTLLVFDSLRWLTSEILQVVYVSVYINSLCVWLKVAHIRNTTGKV